MVTGSPRVILRQRFLLFYLFTFLPFIAEDWYSCFPRWLRELSPPFQNGWGVLRNQRALKAQKYKAWGNAPGIVPVHAMRAVGAKVAVGVTTASIFDNGTPDHFHDNCHWYRLPGLTLRYFYRKQAASRSSEQAHDARLALFLRLQRDKSLMIVYLGRCPRLYTFALSARVDHMGLAHRCHGSHPRHLPWLHRRTYCARSPLGDGQGYYSTFLSACPAFRDFPYGCMESIH